MTTQAEFVERCNAVGLGEGSLFTWLEKVESLQSRIAELEAENANLLAANRDCIEHFNAMQQDLVAAQLQIETLREAAESEQGNINPERWSE